jgi:hypothetical protein
MISRNHAIRDLESIQDFFRLREFRGASFFRDVAGDGDEFQAFAGIDGRDNRLELLDRTSRSDVRIADNRELCLLGEERGEGKKNEYELKRSFFDRPRHSST